MNNNITYLLGAGASANALPTTYEIPTHLTLMADYLEANSRNPGIKTFVNDVKELVTHLNDYNTIDNYARVLYQNRAPDNERKLGNLKSVLGGLFMFEQLRKKHVLVNKYANTGVNFLKLGKTVDLRYKSLFAKILNGNKMDDQVRIISWNYDIQLEIGLESNLGYSYNELSEACSIFPHPSCDIKKINYYSGFFSSETPQIVKLNGTAGLFLEEEKFKHLYLNQDEFFEDRLDAILEVHNNTRLTKSYHPYLRFAWEKDDTNNRAIEYAKAIISRSSILVIVGYSFPDFNRPIDSQIFNSTHLSEIFLQVPEDSVEQIRYNMKSSFRNYRKDPVHIRNLNEFFLPSQFIPSY